MIRYPLPLQNESEGVWAATNTFGQSFQVCRLILGTNQPMCKVLVTSALVGGRRLFDTVQDLPLPGELFIYPTNVEIDGPRATWAAGERIVVKTEGRVSDVAVILAPTIESEP